jgi:hypothetical protein
VHGPDRDRSDQVVAIGEVAVRCGHRDAQAAAGLGQREAAHAALGDQLDRHVHQRLLEVAVVIAAALSGLVRWRR